MPAGRIIILVVGVIGLIILGFMSGNLVEEVNPGEVVVCQDPFDGELHIFTDPGMKPQNFGKCTHYKKSTQFWFSKAEDQGTESDQSIKIRFNDGGHAQVSGSVRVELPLDVAKVTELHSLYGSQHAIEQELIRTVIEKSIYMTGPLMSSKESTNERRNDLINFIEDQAMRGVYKTDGRDTKVKDALSGEERTITVVEVKRDPKTQAPERQEESPLSRFNIKLTNLSLNSIDYSKEVEDQIATQQRATMQVQTAIAEAKKAEQAAITAEKEGQAKAATAKWEQEVEKAKAVTKAQQELEVARLEKAAAAEWKAKEILTGEGEAARKRLVMQADGALEKKLATYEKVMLGAFDSIAKYPGSWVPSVVMGDAGRGGQNGAMDFLSLLSAKAAQDLALQPNPGKK